MQQISTSSINGGSRQGTQAVVIYGHSLSGQEVTTTSLGDVSGVEGVGAALWCLERMRPVGPREGHSWQILDLASIPHFLSASSSSPGVHSFLTCRRIMFIGIIFTQMDASFYCLIRVSGLADAEEL